MKKSQKKHSLFLIIPLILLFPIILVTIGILIWMKKYDQYYANLTKKALQSNKIIIDETTSKKEIKTVPIETPAEVEEIISKDALVSDAEKRSVDDLTRIEGIGPKTFAVLQNADIDSFSILANTSIEDLTHLLRSNGLRARPDTWPQQASLAAIGDWEELKSLQSNLKGGMKN